MDDVRYLAAKIGPRPAGSAFREPRARLSSEPIGGDRGASRDAHVHLPRLEGARAPDRRDRGSEPRRGYRPVHVRDSTRRSRRSAPLRGRVAGSSQAGSSCPAIPARGRDRRNPRGDPRVTRGQGAPAPDTLPLLPLPAVVIGADDGQRLRASAESNGTHARVTCPQPWEGPLQSANLVVDASRTGALVLVLAHYDSVEGSPGANDNASGAALLLRLVRKAPRRRRRFRALRLLWRRRAVHRRLARLRD